MGKYVGIDLGTTFSAVAYINDAGNPELISHEHGKHTMPSTILFNNGKPVIGEKAKRKSISDPKNYGSFVKRHMGEKEFRLINKNGESYRAEEISALILNKLKEVTESRLGENIAGAVVTVPAYFSDPQRQATKDACQLAGIPLLELINEPTAAAIAFGYTRNPEKKQRVLIYDFGGGTFDVSILEIDDSTIDVIATHGDHKLGGADIDKALVDEFVRFAKKKGIDVTQDAKVLQNIWIEAERVKESLSENDDEELVVCVKGEEVSMPISKEDFEDIIYSIVSTTMGIMGYARKEANITYDSLDKIILVGGSTRIPLVKELIEEETGIVPSSEVHPDEAVAIGAAYRALELANRKTKDTEHKENVFNSRYENNDENKVDKSTTKSQNESATYNADNTDNNLPELDKTYEFKDVTSHGIGVVAYDEDDGDYNSVVMPKNTHIPNEVVKDDYSISPGQKEIFLQVTQGESEDLDYVLIVGTAHLDITPKDHRVPIAICVSCDESALIHVYVYDMEDEVILGQAIVDRKQYNMSLDEIAEGQQKINKMLAKEQGFQTKEHVKPINNFNIDMAQQNLDGKNKFKRNKLYIGD